MNRFLIYFHGINGLVFLTVSSIFYAIVGYNIIMVDAYNVNLFEFSGGIRITPSGYEFVGNPEYSLPVILAVSAIIVLILSAVIFAVIFTKTGKKSMIVLSISSTVTALLIYFLISYDTVYFANYLMYRFFFGFSIADDLFEQLQPVLLPQIVFSIFGMSGIAVSFILRKKLTEN